MISTDLLISLFHFNKRFFDVIIILRQENSIPRMRFKLIIHTIGLLSYLNNLEISRLILVFEEE